MRSPSLAAVLRAALAVVSFLPLVLTGCAVSGAAGNPSITSSHFAGSVHGGQQPVGGSKVYLYAASTTSYAGTATSLLGGSGYITADTNGNFNLTGTYTCPAGAQVYALALGGNPGLAAGTNNPKLALMAGLGSCTTLLTTPLISINEETTISTAYALAQFMTSETQAGTSATNVQGLTNAFATIPNLVNPTSGLPPPVTPAGNGTVPVPEINTLADALSACVNSDGTGTACATLMSAAAVTGANGTPIDTVQAALNIAHYPLSNPAAIFGLVSPTSAFQPTLSAAPSDWTMSILYSGGINQAQGLAVDATGNIWISNLYNNNIMEFSPTGALLSPVTGYTAANLYHPQRVALDLAGNIWTPGQPQYDSTNTVILTPATLAKFSPSGIALSGTGFTGGGYNSGLGVLIDGSGNAWAGGSGRLIEFTSAGVPLSPSTGYTGGGLSNTVSVALDPGGNIWTSSVLTTGSGSTATHTGILSKFSSTGVALSPSSGYTGGGNFYPQFIAVDAFNDLWMNSFYGAATGNTTYGGVVEFTSSGTALSPSTGYPVPSSSPTDWTAVDGAGTMWSSAGYTPGYLAPLNQMSSTGALLSGPNGYQIPNSGFDPGIDGSGNLWISGISTLTEVVGIAAPVVTPLVKATTTGKIGVRP